MALLTYDALILPEGRLEIGVVEPVNLSIVAKVLKQQSILAVGMQKGKGSPPCYPIVTQCDIIDFNQLENGSLSILVEGKQRVRIISATQAQDTSWQVKTIKCSNWHTEPIKDEFEVISLALEQFYDVNPDLLALYMESHFSDATWVCQRWLEVLPMYNKDKLRLLNHPNCYPAMKFVLELIKAHGD